MEVHKERIYDDGRYFVSRLSHVDKAILMEEAHRLKSSIDHYRSPHLGSFREFEGMWEVDLSYYGLD